MKGNRHNVIRALGDFLTGVSRYESSDDPTSAPERMKRATEAKRELPEFEPKKQPIAPIRAVKPVKVPAMKPLTQVKKKI